MNYEELAEILTDKLFNAEIELEDFTETQKEIEKVIKNYAENYYREKYR